MLLNILSLVSWDVLPSLTTQTHILYICSSISQSKILSMLLLLGFFVMYKYIFGDIHCHACHLTCFSFRTIINILYTCICVCDVKLSTFYMYRISGPHYETLTLRTFREESASSFCF